MREALWKPHMPYLLAFGILLVVMAVGCAQSPGEGGGAQTSEDQTTVTQASTMAQEETTVGEETTQEETTVGEETTNDQESTSQRAYGGGQIEITMQGEGQRRQGAREEAPASQQTITVRITGTEGLSFAGRIGSAQALRRVQGSVPEKYEIPFEGVAVTAAIRKQEPGRGTLGVEVVRDGEVVASQETSARTGLVNVVWSPQQEQGN